MRATLICSIAATIMLWWSPTPARAGGGAWAFGEENPRSQGVLAWGEHVHAETSLWVPGVGPQRKNGAYWAGPRHGPFYGYISRTSGPNARIRFAPPLPEHSIRVGRVMFHPTEDPHALDVTLDFVMPHLEPGYYLLHHCNVPCTRQIGDLMSTRIVIVSHRSAAFPVLRTHHLDRRFSRIQGRLRNELKEARAGLGTVLARNENLDLRVMELEQEVVALRKARVGSHDEGVVSPSMLLGVMLLTAVVPLGVARMRRRRPSSPENDA